MHRTAVHLTFLAASFVFYPAPEAARTQAEPEASPETQQKTVPPQAVAAEEPVSAPEGSVIHKVWIWQESKDCLWKLAKLYYKDPWKWKRIYLENRNTLLNPNLIFPKQKIVIPPADQKP